MVFVSIVIGAVIGYLLASSETDYISQPLPIRKFPIRKW